jgi:3-deoxy-D-arabino-heptulosonate 7-phosphate (DAHP) synthase class II
MQANFLSNILEAARNSLNIKSSSRVFHPLCIDFVELYDTHYLLANHLTNLISFVENASVREDLDTIIRNLHQNKRQLLEIIENLSGRTIEVYITSEKDNIWNISRKYNIGVKDLCELNPVKNVMKLEEGTVILVPLPQ